MEAIYSDLLSQLKTERCDTHHQQPSIEIIDGKLTVVCCCDDLKISYYKQILKILQSFKKKQTEGVMKVVK